MRGSGKGPGDPQAEASDPNALFPRQFHGPGRHRGGDAIRDDDDLGVLRAVLFDPPDLGFMAEDFADQAFNQPILRFRSQIRIAFLIVGQTGNVDFIAFPRAHHLGDAVLRRKKGQESPGGFCV
jgi:hypothetical protein